MAAPLYQRLVMGVAAVEWRAALETLQELLARRNHRTVIAFRHPSPDDPLLVWHLVHRTMRRGRRREPGRSYPVFLYGRDVPIWAGPLAGWILPRLGAISVFQDGMNRESMEHLYSAVRRESRPIILAPEGQVSYLSDYPGPMIRGAAVLARDARQARDEAVTVLPLRIRYRYPDSHNRHLQHLLGLLEHQISGTHARPGGQKSRLSRGNAPGDLLARVTSLQDSLLAVVAADLESPSREPEALLSAALRHAEHHLDLPENPRDEPLARIFRCRRRYWERLYPPSRLPGVLGDAIADRQANHARLVSRYFQMADVLLYLDPRRLTAAGLLPATPVPIPGTREHTLLAEHVMMLLDLAGRATGGTIAGRPSWRRRIAVIQPGNTISVEPGGRDAVRRLHERITKELAGG